MNGPHPINRTLLTLLDNQERRTLAALDGLSESVFAASPGGDCKSIRDICRHLLGLRRFQLTLLESPLAAEVDDPETIHSPESALYGLKAAASLVRRALAEYEAEHWYAIPDPPRDGLWGDEPTLDRFSRPFNDFVNHLGAVRAIRRINGNPAGKTQ